MTMDPTPKEGEPAALLRVPQIWDSSRGSFFFFIIRGSVRKKKLETKETRETERKMSAPARQSELAPAPWGEGGCCPCCPDPSSVAAGQKGDQVETQ